MHGTNLRQDRVHERRCVVYATGGGGTSFDGKSWTDCLEPLQLLFHNSLHSPVSSFPPYFLIPSLTSSPSHPKYGGKMQRVTINPSFTTMLTRICIPLSPLVNVLSAPLHGNPDFVLISFTGTNPSIHLNLKEIFVWEIKLTIPLGAPFYLL